MSVTDLNEYRARRAGRAGQSMAAHPSGSLRKPGGERWPETDLQPFLDVIDQNIKDLARLVDPPAMQKRQGESLLELMRRAGRPRPDRGSEPHFVVRDETHHFTNNNAAWDRLMADILARGASTDAFARGYATWETPTPERRAEADRLVHILASAAAGEDASATRRAWLNKLSPPRTLRSTDQGSNGGDAESHPGDEGAVPRRP